MEININMVRVTAFILIIMCFSAGQTQWKTQFIGTPTDLWSITSDGQKFISVGSRGTIISSTDTSWSIDSVGIGNGSMLTSVIYALSKYIIVGIKGPQEEGVLFVSSDGKKWTNQLTSTIQGLWSVIWMENKFVVVGQNITGTSSDGMAWSFQSFQGTLYSGVWDGDKLISVGKGGAIYSTSDGISWEKKVSGTDSHLYNIIWTGTQYVSVGHGCTILTSPDSEIWTKQNSGMGFTSKALNSIILMNNVLIAVGTNGIVLSSPDGITWSSLPSGTDNILNSISKDENKLVAVGHESTIITSPIGNNTVFSKFIGSKENNRISLKLSGKKISVHIPYSLQESTISVFSLAGKRIPMLVRKAALASFEIDIRDLAPGVYQIVVEKQGIKTAELFSICR
ncbi:MAG: hypothetical protein JW915_03235 [Chitinispirillaceae bacterium]|nr:hypothetical protein [Chitinispirillaceae bacterium]